MTCKPWKDPWSDSYEIDILMRLDQPRSYLLINCSCISYIKSSSLVKLLVHLLHGRSFIDLAE